MRGKKTCIIHRFVYIIPNLFQSGKTEDRILKKQILLSANFKRDYVAASAILLFALIVISELALAVAIPAYLYRENAMAHQVRKLNLLESFDNARRRCNDVKPRNNTIGMELKLVVWDLDLLAMYLRQENANLTDDDIAALQKYVDGSHAVLSELAAGRSFSNETKFDTATYVNSLIPKRGGRPDAQKNTAR